MRRTNGALISFPDPGSLDEGHSKLNPTCHFPPGDQLGLYEIVQLIGAGSMGQVYRARDTKLNRDVAIKVLPPALANNARSSTWRAPSAKRGQLATR